MMERRQVVQLVRLPFFEKRPHLGWVREIDADELDARHRARGRQGGRRPDDADNAVAARKEELREQAAILPQGAGDQRGSRSDPHASDDLDFRERKDELAALPQIFLLAAQDALLEMPGQY